MTINTYKYHSVSKNGLFNKKIYFNTSYINNTYDKINESSLNTMKYKIYPSKLQSNTIKEWFLIVDKVYNYTNNYIKNKICKTIPYLKNKIIYLKYEFIKDEKKIKETLNFINLRGLFKDKLEEIKGNSSIYKHTIDYAVKLCIEMYKSCYSNIKNKNIKTFNIQDLKLNRKRYNLVLEPSNFNKKQNSFCFKTMKRIKSNKRFKNIDFDHNVILQFDKNKDDYYLLVPVDKKIKNKIKRDEKCGIDIGVRSFMTIYSKSKIIEIGYDTYKDIDKLNNKIDRLKSLNNKEEISNSKFNKKINKVRSKLNNKIEDLHKKTSNFLFKNFKTINIGSETLSPTWLR